MKMIDQFERVYIINLPERNDRRHEIEAELNSIGLQVDGKKIRYFRAIRPDDAGCFPSLGARGCFMSHLAILNEAIADNLDNILVMEDDLSVGERFVQPQPEMCRIIQDKNWHFAYLGHIESIFNNTNKVAWETTNQPLATTFFYALNRPVMSLLRNHLEACLTRPSGHPLGSPMHVDGAYSLFRKQHAEIITLIANPSLGWQRSSRSDIYPNQWYDRTPIFVQLVGLLRKIKNLIK